MSQALLVERRQRPCYYYLLRANQAKKPYAARNLVEPRYLAFRDTHFPSLFFTIPPKTSFTSCITRMEIRDSKPRWVRNAYVNLPIASTPPCHEMNEHTGCSSFVVRSFIRE